MTDSGVLSDLYDIAMASWSAADDGESGRAQLQGLFDATFAVAQAEAAAESTPEGSAHRAYLDVVLARKREMLMSRRSATRELVAQYGTNRGGDPAPQAPEPSPAVAAAVDNWFSVVRAFTPDKFAVGNPAEDDVAKAADAYDRLGTSFAMSGFYEEISRDIARHRGRRWVGGTRAERAASAAVGALQAWQAALKARTHSTDMDHDHKTPQQLATAMYMSVVPSDLVNRLADHEGAFAQATTDAAYLALGRFLDEAPHGEQLVAAGQEGLADLTIPTALSISLMDIADEAGSLSRTEVYALMRETAQRAKATRLLVVEGDQLAQEEAVAQYPLPSITPDDVSAIKQAALIESDRLAVGWLVATGHESFQDLGDPGELAARPNYDAVLEAMPDALLGQLAALARSGPAGSTRESAQPGLVTGLLGTGPVSELLNDGGPAAASPNTPSHPRPQLEAGRDRPGAAPKGPGASPSG